MDFIQNIFARMAILLAGAWRLLGARIGSVHWSFAPWGKPLLTIGLLVAIAVTIFCYYRTTEGLTIRSRISLAALRFGALLALLLMASGAVCAIDLARSELPAMLIVVDDSPSMGLTDGTGTRSEHVSATLYEKGLIEQLRDKYDVRVAHTSGASESASTSDHPQDLASTLVTEASAFSERPLSKILLVSDGIELGNRSLAYIASEVPAPISTLAVGNPKVKDVILRNVNVPPYVYQNDRALITAEVESIDMEGDASVQLVQLKGSGETEVSTTHVTLKPGDEPSIARLEFVAPTAGIQRFTLRVLPSNGELTEKNNAITFHLDVREEKIRVLFIEGEPSWEYKFCKQALETDPVVEFYGMVRLPGDEWFYQGLPTRPDGKPVIKNPRNGFPESADELNFFDVIILGDLERKLYEQGDRFALVESFVKDHAGGLATIGGMKVYGAGDFEGTTFARMLPFEVEKEKKRQLINRFNVQVTTQGMMHPIMQLEYDPALNFEAWNKLPWVEGGNAIRAVKPAATLLLVHPTLKTSSGPRPVAAAWQYGAGRVFSSALDGTWNWRLARETETDYHKRYWGLIVRWLAPDPRNKLPIGALVSEDPAPEVGKPATFSLTARDKDGNAIVDAISEFTIATPSGKTIFARTATDPAVAGRYAITLTPEESGEYNVKVALTRGNEEPTKQERSYAVSPSRAEFLEVRPDAASLANLAKATGGHSASLDQANQLSLGDEPPVVRVERININLWQAPGLLIVLLLCLSLEWLMRKRRGLA